MNYEVYDMMMITSWATTKAVSHNLPSKYTRFAPSNADDKLACVSSSGTIGGFPGV